MQLRVTTCEAACEEKKRCRTLGSEMSELVMVRREVTARRRPAFMNGKLNSRLLT